LEDVCREYSARPIGPSYGRFLEEGLERLLRPLFPRGGAGAELHYVGMRLGAPILSEPACLDLEQTYRGPVWLTLRLTESDAVQPFLLGEVPLLTERDTLIVKGKERTLIGQILLAPGVYFERTEHTVYDANNERQDHVSTWEAIIRPLRGASLRISITGEGDTVNGRVRVGLRKADPYRPPYSASRPAPAVYARWEGDGVRSESTLSQSPRG